VWELRSVNHRYLEVFVRLPESLRALEPQVRERVTNALGRGKVECSLRFQAAEEGRSELTLNSFLAERLIGLGKELESLGAEPTRLAAADVLRWPGVVEQPEPDLESAHGGVVAALEGALQELVAHRSREGGRLRNLMIGRCAGLKGLVAQAQVRRPELLAGLREKWQARLAELDHGVDEGRLEQEMVIAAQRLDVTEELDRLAGHIQEVSDVLNRDDPVGRRLDFLMQEFNREANTLSSKSSDAESTRIAVEMKVLIEQMREQIQNVE
jgi:uncharacterized protein (TIGR00255 family)